MDRRRRHQDGNLIELKHGWSVRLYEDYHDNNGKRLRRRVHKYLGDFQKLPTRRAAQNAMQEELVLVNNFTARPRSTQTFREQAKLWITDCKARKRKPMKPSTLTNREAILENHLLPVLGSTPLSSVDNRAMRDLVAGLVRKKLSPQTIQNIAVVAKLIKASAVDEDGNELYATKWNHKFIDMPIVDETKQHKPSFTGEQVSAIVKAATGRMQMAAILDAASGLRAGELLGLEIRHFDGASVKVDQAVWGGRNLKVTPKGPNSYRIVDLYPDVAVLLKEFIGDRKTGFIFQTSSGKPVTQTNLLRRELHPILETLGISKRGFHSFRRFRNTFLRNSLCPDGLLKFWMGHAAKDMSDHYDRVREDTVFRKDVAKSMGVGFELPKTLTQKKWKALVGVNGRQAPIAQTEGALATTRINIGEKVGVSDGI